MLHKKIGIISFHNRTMTITCFLFLSSFTSGPGCSKLTTSLVNVSLKFKMLISEICQYFLLKKYEKLQKLLSFLQQKYQCI